MTAGAILKAERAVSRMAAKGMTAVGLASAECANHRDAACIGANVPLADRPGPFTMPLPRCLLAMGLPCDYFERCVLPLARKRREYGPAEANYARKVNPLFVPGKTGRLRLADALDAIEDDALRARLWRHPFIVYAAGTEPAERLCPDCQRPLPRRARYCEECRRKRRKQGYRASKRRKRDQVSTVRHFGALSSKDL